jgi:NADPH2:quinone reductase
VDYTKPNWQKEVMQITGGKGVDVIYDPVGMIRGESRVIQISVNNFNGSAFLDCLKCIAFRGRAVVVGFAGGKIEKVISALFLVMEYNH